MIAEYRDNRQAKLWQVRNGSEGISFPAGPVGKSQAQRCALEINRPDLAAMDWKIRADNDQDPDVSKMALKAAYILHDKLLYSNGVVKSQSRENTYHEVVKFSGIPKHYHCTCEAKKYCPVWIIGIGWLCKHGLAAHMAYLLNIKLPDQIKEQDYT